jgi:hypothetical protein
MPVISPFSLFRKAPVFPLINAPTAAAVRAAPLYIISAAPNTAKTSEKKQQIKKNAAIPEKAEITASFIEKYDFPAAFLRLFIKITIRNEEQESFFIVNAKTLFLRTL